VFIGVPASTSAADAQAVEQDWKVIGSFEDSTWILVEIDGGVTHAVNPACAALPPFWGCTRFPLAGITAGPSTPFTSGRVDLWENGAGAPLYYRPTGGDPNALSARALSFRRVAGSVSARRHVEIAGAIEPLANQPRDGAYLLSGGQTVRLRAIPPPLGISGPADLAPGESGTYTAVPLFGLQLANPYGAHHLPPGAYGWTFHPGDTAAVPRKRVDVAVPMWHCENQPTCDYTPSESGRLAVFAYVEDQLVGAYSDVIRVNQPRLRVACDPNPVTRGEETVCEVAAAGGAVKPTTWEFSGRGVRIARPAAEAHETVWSGIMTVSGYVRVTASVGSSQPVSDSVLVEVLPRNWRFRYPDAPAPKFVGLPDLPYPPIISLGERLSDGDLGMYWPAKYSWPSRPADGINAGFAFVSGPLTFDEPPMIHINQGLKPDDPFFLAQRGVVRGRTYVYVPCDRMHMDSAASFVVNHEYGHHEVEKQFWESVTTAQFVDSMVVYNPAGRAVVDTPSIAPLKARRRVLQDGFDRSNTLVLRCQLHPIDEG
jgi:hypothetical protein